jgi:hypothetical protein
MFARNKALLFLILCLSVTRLNAQDLMSVLNDNEKPRTDYTDAIFKTTRIVIGQAIQTPEKGTMLFLITHHFGAINTGYENLYGLKQATIRLGTEIGITDNLGMGVGLNTYNNTWDGFVKYRILRQSTGARKMPINLTAFVNTAIYTTKWSEPNRMNYFTNRMSYTFELMIARKFGKWVSLQLMPALVHKNMVPTRADHNDIFTLGAGGRVKVSNRVSINAEYYYLFPNQVVSTPAYSSFSVGVDIETGGHVFQIFLTNSTGEFEQAFMTETSGKWANGNIFLGFNITRVFDVFGSR